MYSCECEECRIQQGCHLVYIFEELYVNLLEKNISHYLDFLLCFCKRELHVSNYLAQFKLPGVFFHIYGLHVSCPNKMGKFTS